MSAHIEHSDARNVKARFVGKRDGDGHMLYLEDEYSGDALVLCGTTREIRDAINSAINQIVQRPLWVREQDVEDDKKRFPETFGRPTVKPIQSLIQKAHDKGLLRYAPPNLVWDDQPANRQRQFELRRTAMSGVEFGYILSTDEITWAIQSIDGVELEPGEFLQELQRTVGVFEKKPSVLAWDNERSLESALKDVDMFGFGKDVDNDSIVEEAAKSHLERLKEQPCQHYAATRAIVDEEPEVTAHNDEPKTKRFIVSQISTVDAVDEDEALELVVNNIKGGNQELVEQRVEPELKHYEVGDVNRYWAEDEEHAVEQFMDDPLNTGAPNFIKEVE